MILGLLLGCFSLWIVVSVWIDISFSSNLPRVPDETTGRIYRMVVNHGTIRYGSAGEVRFRKTAENCMPVAILLFLTASVLGLKWGILHFRKP